MTMTGTISERLAQFTDGLQFEDMPPEVVDKAKRLVLDTVGVCIGSTQIDFGKSALDMISGWGGTPDATLIGRRTKVPLHSAALCNGILGHGQDYDDTHAESVVHPSAALVPVALAAAERSGSSGREMLTALVAGLEATIRIAMPAYGRFHLRGFHTTSVASTFGAAAITAKLERAGLRRTVEALGVAGSFASGLLECIPAGSYAKRLHAGWAGHCGVMATQFAQRDCTGPSTIFEGKLGAYNSFLRGESLDLDVIFKGIGREWTTLDIRPKLYPACHYLQAFLECAAHLRRTFGIRPEDIEAVSCRIVSNAVGIICEPWENKLAPNSDYDTRFSLPFAVAVMLVRGRAGVAEFSAPVAADPQIRKVMGKVSYVVEPRYQVKDFPAAIDVAMKDGRRHSWEVPEVRGDAKTPFTLDELMEKFTDNTAHLGAAASSRIAGEMLGLESQADIRRFMADLCEPA
ncbi:MULTISPECIES: MmgE/PrpD family protein [unclassified Variovorax]|uniref:MmgE/PrpD family protein n=1 Tax=unclassified Variovorax TaxID=663243 RepID=UPI0009FF1798|nr:MULTISPECIES: MmgE/PrpD family protein [unclassified Variovorax]PNG46014.1 hypothetical protein CHC06_07992 [Variovorax sp. B2]PNG46329.1 hypothetical protein CHC07_08077 [Variovorax sp. B4]VTV19114.1 2-methylcitrate dehydratase [Variovorax sp. WDL1]